MCGIAGFCNFKEDFEENTDYWNFRLEKMRAVLAHRGNDARGRYLKKHIGLSHSRLAIRDILCGDQPMTRTHNGYEYTICYNGEIYNTDELIPELSENGFVCSTTSDTEVILYAYIHWGADFVNRLNGIFAFAIWDAAKSRLLLYRDRVGVKPLFYAIRGDSLVFGSEPKACFAHPAVKPELDKQGLQELLAIGPAHTSGLSLFKDLFEVLPVCTFLSGGIDSSIVTAIAANYMNTRGKTLNTFSFDFKDNDRYFKANAFQPERDLPYVNRMLEEYETAHSYLECDENSLFKALFAAVDAKDMPGMTDVDSSLLYFCSLVSRKNKVALTGECADEIFGGYPWFYCKELLERYGFPWSSDVAPRLALLRDDVGLELDLSGYQAFQYEESRSKAPLLYGEAGEDESRRIIGYLNIKWFMQTLLDRMDRTSMYSELEARVPFADHRIIEYVFNVPWHMKYQNGVEKTLLRDAFSDVLPPELLHRKKSPYPKTYHPGYEALLIKGMEEILDSPNAPVRTLIDTDKTREFLKAPAEYGSPWFGQLMAGPQLIAYFIQINYWMEKYQLSA